MSRSLGTVLPPPLKQHLDSADPPRLAVPLVTVDDRGFPHLALLSYFELLAREGHVFCFVDSASRTSRYLSAAGRCTLLFFLPEFVYYLKGEARSLEETKGGTLFQIAVRDLLQDDPRPGEESSGLLSGLAFAIPEREARRRLQLREEIASRVSVVDKEEK